VEIGGVGVLLLGPSGVGKSECALELVQRGHRLVADDVVELERLPADTLRGRAPKALRHFMEIRGLGILSVADLFGPESIREEARVDLICRLDDRGEPCDYERVGAERPTELLAGVPIPRVVLPARLAGSMATIVEIAARDHTLRTRGVNAAERLDAQLRDTWEGQ
jgi:HPr kinase/phosphorylase